MIIMIEISPNIVTGRKGDKNRREPQERNEIYESTLSWFFLTFAPLHVVSQWGRRRRRIIWKRNRRRTRNKKRVGGGVDWCNEREKTKEKGRRTKEIGS